MLSEKGFICISTLDRFDELGRFLKSFKKYNSLPIIVLVANDIADAHRIKTNCAFLTPFLYTCLMDTDILVNGDLSEIFLPALQNRIGIVREKTFKVLNSGVIVFPREKMKVLCKSWNEKYEVRLKKGYDGKSGTWEQGILNDILKKFPVVELPSKFNHILKDYTPEQELEVYDSVKIFHFLHAPDIDRNKYKSYQTFMSL